jgi:3-phenylpropionate/trans-cinnamate dioxygenase ferredoxin component
VARVAVGPLSAIPDGRCLTVRVGALRVALFRSGDSVFAIDDRCTHRGFPLNDGVFSGTTVRCRNHGACFDLATGAVEQGPASRPIRVFRVEIADGQLIVILPDPV